MKKTSKNKNSEKKNSISPNLNINNNANKKYDLFQLQCLLEELEKKDLEYDLIIKGLKEKINSTKRENNKLEKEIEQLQLDNNNMNKNNKRLNLESKYKEREMENKIEYKNNMENLNKKNYLEKYNEELNKNKEIKDNISKTLEDINTYKNRLFELESILNYTNPDIQKQGENMKKFLSEL